MRARSSMRRLLVPATLVGLWACGQERASDPPPGHPTTTRRPVELGYREIDVELGGSVSGRVTWVGDRPPTVTARGGAACPAEVEVPVLALGPRGGVRGSVIVLAGVREGRARTENEATLRIADCGMEPHVVAVGVGEDGATLRLQNGERILHNAHATDPRGATRFDVGLPAEGASVVSLERPGILRVLDDAGHPALLGWVHVIEHPYFAVTDATGSFRIPAVPAGQYTLQVWHEGVRSSGLDGDGRPRLSAPIFLSRMVTVVAGQDTAADFSIDLRIADAAGEAPSSPVAPP